MLPWLWEEMPVTMQQLTASIHLLLARPSSTVMVRDYLHLHRHPWLIEN
jgi:hypothetical protein